MSNFLKLVQEAMPEPNTTDNTGTGQLAADANKSVKKGSIIGKAASFAQKTAALANKIGDIGQGKWDIEDALQKILDRQLDKSTNKIGYFGKSGFNKIKLGDDIIKKINAYGSDVPEPGKSKPETDAVEANESFTECKSLFLAKLNETTAIMTDRDDDGKIKTAHGSGKGAAARLYEVIKKFDSSINFKVVDINKKSADDKRLQWITKKPESFLSKVQSIYPDIKFTFSKNADSLSVAMGDQNKVEDAETKFGKTKSGKELPLDYKGTSNSEWIESIGKKNMLTLLKAMVDIYPNLNIKLPAEEPEPAEDSVVTPDSKLTIDNALFELTGRTSFGEKGIQYTLKPLTPDVANILKDRNIKYLTYLLQSKDNKFKTAEGNSGIIYAYDNENQPINPITTEGVNFQWNGQDKVYTLSTANKQLMGVQYSAGQYPINKTDVKPLTDGKHILMRPDEKSGYMKFLILQDLPSTQQYLINYTKGVAATEAEIKEAEAKANPSPTSEVRK